MTREQTDISKSIIEFMQSLIWYLESRNWGFTKIITCPHGSHPTDIRIHHHLYFTSLISAIEYTSAYVGNINKNEMVYTKPECYFDNSDDYNYAKELRNAIVHRGFDPNTAGRSVSGILLIKCPGSVHNKNCTKTYSVNFAYTSDLVSHLNHTTNQTLLSALTSIGIFEHIDFRIYPEELMEDIQYSDIIPEWAKAMAAQTIGTLNFDEIASDIVRSLQAKLRELLSVS